MNERSFNARSDAVKSCDQPGLGDDVACEKCAAVALDTGLECTECGHDNYEAIAGRPFEAREDTVTEPERMGLDAIRQAIEERDAMERKYHDLAEHMVYQGNSVSWWYSKATAYRSAIDEVWDALRAAGIRADSVKTCADGVRELAARLKA